MNFSEDCIKMYRINHLEPEVWYSIENPKILDILSNVENYQELLILLDSFDSKSNIFEKTDFIVKIEDESYILEGYKEGKILHLLLRVIESSRSVNFVNAYGLINSKIGIAWSKKIEGEYRIFHSTSSRAIYGKGVSKQDSRKVYSNEYEDTVNEIIRLHPEYIEYFEKNKLQTESLLKGDIDYLVTDSPWLNTSGELIWVEDRMSIVTKSSDGTADMVVSVT
ncbi:MAG: hypothetical protein JXR62_05140, partial [Bacilli bacterium]|nr:hypothetical protein [Bacilli bacterium]